MSKYNKIFDIAYDYPRKLGLLLPLVFSYRYIKVYAVIAGLVNIIIWATARFIVGAIDLPQIALHYSVDFGIDLYGKTNYIFIIPLLGLIIILINFLIVVSLIKYSQKEVQFIFHLLLASSLIANIILLAATISVYIINFR